MSTLATINGSDLPTNSRANINDNFAALNTEKMETSVLDTDTTLAANSDTKIPSQKAVKAYVDAGGNVNASTTGKGIVELATSAEINAGTATGGTGAPLVVTPDALKATQVPTVQTYVNSGSPHTWTKPAGLKYVVVECQGAGGSGATDGASGGGGGYTKKVLAAASCGATETVTVGAGSAGSGNTSFGSLLTAGNGGNASGDTPGTAGAATGGDLNIPGQAGVATRSDGYGGNDGGNSFMGFGGQIGYNAAGTSTRTGTSGSGFGGGGAGGQQASDGSPSGGTGGAGAPGIVVVTEYYV